MQKVGRGLVLGQRHLLPMSWRWWKPTSWHPHLLGSSGWVVLSFFCRVPASYDFAVNLEQKYGELGRIVRELFKLSPDTAQDLLEHALVADTQFLIHELLPVCRFDIKLQDTANSAQCFIDRHCFACLIAASDDCCLLGLAAPCCDVGLDRLHDVPLHHRRF